MKDLTKRMQEIVDYRLANPELTQEQLAKEMGISAARISKVLSSSRVTKAYPLLARRRFEQVGIVKAVGAYEHCIEQNDNLAVKEKASGAVLREFGVFDAPTVRLEGEITLKSVCELQEKVKTAAKLTENAVDAEVIDLPTTQP